MKTQLPLLAALLFLASELMTRAGVQGFEQALLSTVSIGPLTVSAELPIGLSHIDSEACWCDPIVETDDEGEEIVVHRQVTWN